MGELQEAETLTVAQAALKLGVSDTSVYRLIYSGSVKVITGFGRMRIPRSELDKFVKKLCVYTPRKRGKKEVGA
jgi:excisionase family DNA binding protein